MRQEMPGVRVVLSPSEPACRVFPTRIIRRVNTARAARFDVEKNCVILKKLPKCEFLLWVMRESSGRAAGLWGAGFSGLALRITTT